MRDIDLAIKLANDLRYGDRLFINDLGSYVILSDVGSVPAYLVLEEDGEINWYLNPTRSDTILLAKDVELMSLEEFEIGFKAAEKKASI